MRLLSFAAAIFSFACYAQNPEKPKLRELVPVEGIYQLNVVYHSQAAAKPYPKLDRLVVFASAKAGEVQLALAESDMGMPFIRFSSAEVRTDAATGHYLINGLGDRGGHVFGQISIDLDPVNKTFTGYFTDSLAEGYKTLSGKALCTLSDFLRDNGGETGRFVPGIYKEVKGTRRLIIRSYSDGSLSAGFQVPSQLTETDIDSFGEGVYLQELGVLMLKGLVPTKNSALKKLSLVAHEQKNGEIVVDGQLVTTSGRWTKLRFVRTGDALIPDAWSSAPAQESLKSGAAKLRTELSEQIKAGQAIQYLGEIQVSKLTAVMSSPDGIASGHTTFFIGYREDFIPRSSFTKFLDHHLKLVWETFRDKGLRGYYVLATQDYEIAVMNWKSEEDMNRAFTEKGAEITADAQKFMRSLVWEKF